MSKVALQAKVCYNLSRNIVVPEGTVNTLWQVTHLLRRRITMDTLPPHADYGNTPETTFIYRLRDPETKLIRYVGKADNPHKRLIAHKAHSRYNRSDKSVWIASLVAKGLMPELEIIEEVLCVQWEECECYWIAYYREQGAPLTNKLDGGNALPETYKRSAATCSLISQIHMGMTKTPEQREAQSAKYKELGIKPPPHAYETLRNRLKDKPVDPDVLAKKRATMQAKKEAGIPSKKRTTSESLRAKRKAYMTAYWQSERGQQRLRKQEGDA